MGQKVTDLAGIQYRIPCQTAAERGYWLCSVRVLIARMVARVQPGNRQEQILPVVLHFKNLFKHDTSL